MSRKEKSPLAADLPWLACEVIPWELWPLKIFTSKTRWRVRNTRPSFSKPPLSRSSAAASREEGGSEEQITTSQLFGGYYDDAMVE